MAGAGVPYELVPGVTSAIAAPAAAGIPLTDRRCASMLTIVTGHQCEKAKGASPDVDWAAISPKSTLVVLMGAANLAKIFAHLRRLGWRARTPAAAISRSGWPGEKTFTGTLESLPALIASSGLEAPAVIIVGKVVALARSSAC